MKKKKDEVSNVPFRNCRLDVKNTKCQNGTYTSSVTVIGTSDKVDCVYKNIVLENTTGFSKTMIYQCPIDCVIGKNYTNSICDGSKRVRTRLDDVPPINNGLKCPKTEETQQCNHCVIESNMTRTCNWTNPMSTYLTNRTVTSIATNGGTCPVNNITGLFSVTGNCSNIMIYENLTGSGTLPFTSWNVMTIEMVGGGGSGGSGNHRLLTTFAGGGGGGAGESKVITINYDPSHRGMSYTYKLGKGGDAFTPSDINDAWTYGNAGDTTFTFNGQTYTVKGGKGGGNAQINNLSYTVDIGLGGVGGGDLPPTTAKGMNGTKTNSSIFSGGDGGESFFGKGGSGAKGGVNTGTIYVSQSSTSPVGYGAGGGGGLNPFTYTRGMNGAVRIRFS